MKCRFDQQPLTEVFVDLGFSPPSNSFLTKEQLNQPETYFPLKLYVNERNFLVQVDEYEKADKIFSADYLYFSSFSSSWLAHSKQYVEMMMKRFGFTPAQQVIEIASNDGYLLQYFQEKGIPVLGIEPTLSTATVAREKGIETITEFFGVKLAQQLVANGRQADLLLGNNVLAHVPDLNDFVGGLKLALKSSGIITMEFPHIMQLIDQIQFDTIYHEHFSYFTFHTVQAVFAHHGLTLFDVEETPTHGGSLRIFARHAENEVISVSERVSALLRQEVEKGMTQLPYYQGFQQKIIAVKNQLLTFLLEQAQAGKKVGAYGAAAKGNTLLNYCGIKPDLLPWVVDASPYKQGKYLPGTHIPVLKEAIIRAEQPDYVLILPWNIKEEVCEQLRYIREWGGKFVTAIPELKIW